MRSTARLTYWRWLEMVVGYADGTTVSVGRSREELQALLERAGASEFGYVSGADGRARVGFKLNGLACAIELPIPKEAGFGTTPTGKRRSDQARTLAWDQEKRRRWRALLLIVKAKLEAIECGITTSECEFMANVVLADGRLLADHIRPRLAEFVASGRVPSLLPAGEAA